MTARQGRIMGFMREMAALAPFWAPLAGALAAALGVTYHWIADANHDIHRHLDRVDSRLQLLEVAQNQTVDILHGHSGEIKEAQAGERQIGADISAINATLRADETHWASVEDLLGKIVSKMIPERRAGDEPTAVPVRQGPEMGRERPY